MDHNEIIQRELDTMAKQVKANGETFKFRAYQKVIQQLKAHKAPIRTMDDLNGITGIGEKIRLKIQEILEKGHLSQAEAIRKAPMNPKAILQTVYGIGPKKAEELVKMGITSIEELRKREDLLHDKQRIGLKYVEPLLQRIPRKEMEQHDAFLQKHIQSIPGLEGMIVGSYRRKRPDSGDIDTLICSENPHDLSNFLCSLQKSGYILENLAIGEKKFMGIVQIPSIQIPRRLDILWTPPTQYPFATLYFTGSDKFNIEMRKVALQRGYSLNEHGFTPSPENVKFQKEEDIFNFLQMTYVSPEERGV